MRTALLLSSSALLLLAACAEAPETDDRITGQAPTLSEVMRPEGVDAVEDAGMNMPLLPGAGMPEAKTPKVTEASTEEDAPEEAPVLLENFSAAGSVVGSEGTTIGQVDVQGGPHGVIIRVMLDEGALTPGWHGLHLHQVGDCSDIGEFKLSGGHVGKVEGGHGFMNPEGPEGGDLPNIWVADNGSAGYEAFTTLTRRRRTGNAF